MFTSLHKTMINIKIFIVLFASLVLICCEKEKELPPNPNYQPSGLNYSQIIVVQINDITNSDGNIQTVLYNNSATWNADMDSHLSENMYSFIETPANLGSIIVKFDSIPVGNYAISLLQDENSNGYMDMGGFLNLFPQEPYGFSNNIVPSTSAPSFNECSFSINETDSLFIEINLVQP